MAERLLFIATDPFEKKLYREELISFTYHSGFGISQKQKSIQSLHENALQRHSDLKPLEVSSKSEEALGVRLSAFNLMFYDESSGSEYPIENVFQASKVYKNGGPYLDLLNASPGDAKRDLRHHTSGALTGFRLGEWECSLEPKTMFYDWIYCKALWRNADAAEILLKSGYNAFTDIEFNHKKSVNCQARSVAIFVSLSRRALIEEYLHDKFLWKSIYSDSELTDCYEQLSMDLFQ